MSFRAERILKIAEETAIETARISAASREIADRCRLALIESRRAAERARVDMDAAKELLRKLRNAKLATLPQDGQSFASVAVPPPPPSAPERPAERENE